MRIIVKNRSMTGFPDHIGYQNDNLAEEYEFILPRNLGGSDLAEGLCQLLYILPDQSAGVILLDKTVTEEEISARWIVGSEVTGQAGLLRFELRVSGLGALLWHSEIGMTTVSASIPVHSPQPVLFRSGPALRMSGGGSPFPENEPPITITERKINIPGLLQNIAVQNDENSETVKLLLPRWFDGNDLSQKSMFLKTINANGERDDVPLLNPIVTADTVELHWVLKPPQTSFHGKLQLQLYVQGMLDGTTDVPYKWETEPTSVNIVHSLDGEPVIPVEPSVMTEFLQHITEIAAGAKASEDNAKASETSAAASASAAKSSEQNARTSETNASASAAAAKTSEGAAKQSEENAASSASAAGTSEQNTKASEVASASSASAALASQTAAKASEDRAKSSEMNAAASAAAAKNSETAAKSSVEAAKASQTAASASESSASTSATAAAASAANAKTSETNAAISAAAAKSSEQNAAASEGRAKTSETNAKASETSAAASATAARASEQNAKASETAAKASQTAAASSAQDALESKNAAQASETAASTSASTATTKAQEASESAASALVQANRAKSEADRASAIANNLGWFATPEALRSAHSTGEDGWIAIIGTTDSIWTWDSDSSAWVDTQNKGTGDYATMINKPQINGITLEGNRSLPDLGIQPEGDYATAAALTSGLAGKVDKVTGKGLSAEDYTTAEKTKLAGLSNYDDGAIRASISALDSAVTGKVDKVAGKGLSTNDYTDGEKTLVATIPSKADTVEMSQALAGKQPVGNYAVIGEGTESTVITKSINADTLGGFPAESFVRNGGDIDAATLQGKSAADFYQKTEPVDAATLNGKGDSAFAAASHEHTGYLKMDTDAELSARLTVGGAQDLAVAQARNIIISPTEPTNWKHGDLWLKYTPAEEQT